MRGLLWRIKENIRKWIQGRYGQDELYLFLLIVSFALLLLSSISWVFYALTFYTFDPRHFSLLFQECGEPKT